VAGRLERKALAQAEAAIAAGDPAKARPLHDVLIRGRVPAPVLYRLAMLEAGAQGFAAARRLLQAARAQAPGDVNILVNLAQVEAAAGNPSAALELIDALPGPARQHPAVSAVEGGAAAQLGEHGRAVPALRRAAAAGEAPVALLSNLGVALRATGETAEAVAVWRRALARDPDAVMVRANLADHLIAAEDFSGAETLLQAGLARDPVSAVLLRQRAQLSRARSDGVGAERDAWRALAVAPGDPSVLGLLGDLADMRARLDRAAFWGRAIGCVAPGSLQAARLTIRTLRRQGALDEATARARLWLDRERAPARRHPILFELGQALDRAGRYDEALAAFDAANRCQIEAAAGSPLADPGRAFAQLDALQTLHRTAEALPALTDPDHRPAGRADADPIFLVGFPRSGTTLLDQVLDAHPDVTVIEERPIIAEIIAELATFQRHYPADLFKLKEEDKDRLRVHYLDSLARVLPTGRSGLVIDKMPLNMAHVALIRTLFPGARFILVLRDPRDVVLSAFMQGFRLNPWMAALGSLDGAVRLYQGCFAAWESYWTRFRELHGDVALDAARISIRYEDMVADLAAAVTPVLGFLGLDWRPEMARFHDHARERGNLATPSAAQVTEPIYSRSVARWHNYAEALAPASALLLAERRRYGYLDDGES